MNEEILKWFDGDELAAKVWLDKYALRDDNDNLLEDHPKKTFIRIAKEFARIEEKYPNPILYEEILELLLSKTIIPAGSPLFGIGNKFSLSSLGNCFVIGNQADSYGGILKDDEELVQLMKRRAGVGLDLSHLRYYKAPTTNSAKSSTGTVPFMERYSNSTREVAQEGRRGALMLSLDISHPDILKFIEVKDDRSKVTGANVSVKITDEFMKAVENDEPYELKFIPKSTSLVDKKRAKQVKSITVSAKHIWDKIVHQAWKSAEPGILFWDTIKKGSPADCYESFQSITTNPCGEIPLNTYDSCRLLSINLYKVIKNPFTKNASIDFEKLNRISYVAQKLMDDLVDLEREKIEAIIQKIESDPEPEDIKRTELSLWSKILNKLLLGRRTGLSGIGLADMLASLNLKYDANDSIYFTGKVYREIARNSYMASLDMAADRGCFLEFDYDEEKHNPFLNRVISTLSEDYQTSWKESGRRNIANLTIPPSGSISLISGISSGIEPVFNLSYTRRRKVDKNHPNVSYVDQNGDTWEEYKVTHPKLKTWFKNNVFDITWEQFLEDDDLYLDTIKDCPYFKSTTNDINPQIKLMLQAVAQNWVDHSISVTNNLPEDTTEKEVSDIYFEAWKLGLKGCTIYREGSRSGVLINEPKFNYNTAFKRPKTINGEAYSTIVKGEKFTVIVGLIDNKVYEVFAYKGNGLLGSGQIVKQKKRYYIFKTEEGEFEITNNLTDEQEAITRGYSYGLRHGGDVKFAVEQLNKTKGDLTSFSKAIARVLKKYIPNQNINGDSCPECHNKELQYADGCIFCKNCGWTKC